MRTSDFDQLMIETDERLREQGVAVSARPFHAVPLIAARMKIAEEIPIDASASGGQITPANLYAHIHRWYDQRYGDRLKTEVGPGNIALEIRGEAWKARLPLVYGAVEIVADRQLSTEPNPAGIRAGRGDKIPTLNVLDTIESLPQALATSLTDEELGGLFHDFLFDFDVLQELHSRTSNDALLQAAFTDLDVAVEKLVGNKRDYGQSRWSSLQFTEKALKSALQRANVQFSRTHALSKLATLGRDHGVFSVDDDLLANIQCTAGIRYGGRPATLDQALTAHRASIRVVAPLTKQRP